MNTIKINNEYYKLPQETNVLATVLNHLNMVEKGLKNHINLYDMEGNKKMLSKLFIQNSKIEINVKNA